MSACTPVRVRRGADVGTVLDVGTVNEAGRAVFAVLVMVDNAGPDCREWWPAAGCEIEGSAPRATRAARVGRRILAELRADGVSRGAEVGFGAVVGDLVGRDDVPELGRVLRDVAREMATPEGLTDATAAALTEAIDTLDTEARRS